MNGRCESCNGDSRQGILSCFVNEFGKVIPLACDKLNGFYLLNGQCVNQDLPGYFKDDITGWYTKCDCNCKTCAKSSRNCIECPFGFILSDWNRCIPDVGFTAAWEPDYASLRIVFS